MNVFHTGRKDSVQKMPGTQDSVQQILDRLWNEFENMPPYINATDDNGSTPLLLAVGSGNNANSKFCNANIVAKRTTNYFVSFR